MSDAVVAGRAPLAVEVETGKTYWWCRCGLSRNQPFCDGAHRGSGFTPLKYEAGTSGKLWFCACKRTAGAPLCDGSHRALPV